MKNFYDKIIFGSSIKAIYFAINSKLHGESVLLLNQYGFLGGDITESLTCFKPISFFNEMNLLDAFSKSFFYQDSFNVVVNPEYVKFFLLEKLQSNQIDFLFHVFPFEIILKNESVELKLITKENHISISCNTLYDATDNNILFNIYHNKNYTSTKSLNFFITKTNKPEPLILDNVEFIKLNDGRFFATIKFENQLNNFFDYQEFEIVKKFDLQLKKFGSRIQVLPLRPQYESSLKELNINNKLISLKSN